MNKSFQKKTQQIYTFVIILCCFLTISYVTFLSAREYNAEVKLAAEKIINAVQNESSYYLSLPDFIELQRKLDFFILSTETIQSIVVEDANGHQLLSSVQTTPSDQSAIEFSKLVSFPSYGFSGRIKIKFFDGYIKRNIMRNYILSISGCILIFFAGWLILFVRTKAFLKPAKMLIFNIKRISKGDLKYDAAIFSKDEFEVIDQALAQMCSEISRLQSEIKAAEKQKALGQIAQQVAHDIRSPLAALDVAISFIAELSEEKRILIRNAIARIRDIANNLAEQGKNISLLQTPNTQKLDELSIQLLPGLVESLITEKRTQYRDQIGLEIEAHFNENSYGLFAKINPAEFKRVLSNLINNAVEALAEKGKIAINLTSSANSIVIEISDNGKGVPSHFFPKLMQHGSTFGKEKGSGLGLYHAKHTLESWGGMIAIESELNEGTKVVINLPKEQAPNWFVPKLQIQPNSAIVILDDDISIHQVWETRLKKVVLEFDIDLYHFSTEDELINWCSKEQDKPCFYLIDHELIGKSKSGLILIEELGIASQSVLVTSHYEEPVLLERCQKIAARLIPKPMAGFVPIEIEFHQKEKFDAVLIDNDLDIHLAWTLSGQTSQKKIKTYFDADTFLADSQGYDKSTPIYVDSDLGINVRGEEISKQLSELGFTNLYLATGYTESVFSPMPWLKGITGKAPPW